MERPFAALAGIGALATATGLAPDRVKVPFLSPMVTSLIVTELAPWHLAGQMAGATALVRGGALGGPLGRAALVANTASWAGLAHMIKTARHAHEAFEAEFERAGIKLHLDDPPVAPLPWRSMSDISRTLDVSYAAFAGGNASSSTSSTNRSDSGDPAWRLDVYEPRERTGDRAPAIVQIHGGSWASGDKSSQGIPLLHRLAKAGWVGFNVNYRLSPGVDALAQLRDLKAALAFIRTSADRFGIDPSRIAVTGGSAGGHLAALVGLTANDRRYQPGFEEVDTSVAAVVPFYGVFDFTNDAGDFGPTFVPYLERVVVQAKLAEEPERFRELSPLYLVETGRSEPPPFLLIHGLNDTVVSANESQRFATALRRSGSATTLHVELPGAQHAFDVLRSTRTNTTIAAIEAFLTHTV